MIHPFSMEVQNLGPRVYLEKCINSVKLHNGFYLYKNPIKLYKLDKQKKYKKYFRHNSVSLPIFKGLSLKSVM